jgi:DNA repair protein RadC
MARRKASPTPITPIYSPHEDAVIVAALAILEARMKVAGCAMSSLDAVRSFLRLQLGALDREVFGVLFLNSQHKLIAFEIVFEGTLTQTSVYPREVVRLALTHNAAAVILTHNHPSGSIEPSQADVRLTLALKDALRLVDVRVLDHMVVGHGLPYSFAENGLISGAEIA